MLSVLRASRTLRSLALGKTSKSHAGNFSKAISRPKSLAQAYRPYCQTSAAVENAISQESIPKSTLKSATPTLKDETKSVVKDLQKILKSVASVSDTYLPTHLNQSAEQVSQFLTTAIQGQLQSASKRDADTLKALEEVGVLYLRTGRVEELDNLMAKCVRSVEARATSFNRIWSQFIENDIRREEFIAFRTQINSIGTKFLHSYTIDGPSASLLNVARSLSLAISQHDILPTETTVSNLVLLTLRLIPADLKQVRKEVVRNDAPKEEIQEAEEQAQHHDLTPTNSRALLPDITSIYGAAPPAHRRPIPVQKAHKVMRDALTPIWDILKPIADKLEYPTVHTLLVAFNKATLVQPTLHLIPTLKKFDYRQISIAPSYAIALSTLCDDIQYEHVYTVFKNQLLTKKNGDLLSFVRNDVTLLALVLQGISRAPSATDADKDMVYEAACKVKALTPEALGSYGYALARNAKVSSSRLFAIFEAHRSNSWDKHRLRYMNELFSGLTLRGSLNLAYKVLEEMWSRRAVISVRSLNLYLERCIYSEQSSLVKGALEFMRPANSITLHSDRGRQAITTSKTLPVHVQLSHALHDALFEFWIRSDQQKQLDLALDVYQAEGHSLDRKLFDSLLAVCGYLGRPTIALALVDRFEPLGVSITTDSANQIIKALNKAKRADEAVAFFQSFSSRSIRPNENTFASLAFSRGLQSQQEQVLGVLDEMNAMGLKPSVVIYNAILAVLAPASLDNAEWVLQNMKDNNITPDLRSYTILMKQYATQGNNAMFTQHYDEAMQLHGLQLDARFCKSLLEEYIHLGELKPIIETLLPLMEREQIQQDIRFKSTLAVAYCHFDRDDLTDQVISYLPLKTNIQHQTRLVNEIFVPIVETLASRSLERTWKMITLMEQKYGVAVGLNLYRSIIRVVSDEGDEEKKKQALAWIENHLHPEEFGEILKAQQL